MLHRYLRIMVVIAGLLPLSSHQATAKELDIYFVPTPQPMVDQMLRLAHVTGRDVVFDLGSGDGRIVITAAERFGASGVGIDLDPVRIAEGKANAEAAQVTDKVRFVNGDLFQQNISSATVVTLYLLESINERLRPKLLNELRPGTRVLSHDFTMGPWQPDAQVQMAEGMVYLWVVPANVGGQWSVTVDANGSTQEFPLALQQEFQAITGEANVMGAPILAEAARLHGDDLDLQLRDGHGMLFRFRGKVDGDAIEGRVFTAEGDHHVGSWHATRQQSAAREGERETALRRR